MITAAEKAQQLVDKMHNIPDGDYGSVGIHEAKECALVAVNEIISELEENGIGTDFWYEVKQEIEKL